MLRSVALVAPLAQLAFGAVANFCVEDPFKQMQHFRDFEPAISRCAVHYPAQTVVKTLSNACLTATQTVILGTSTVHATNHLACPTPHLEIRDEEGLEKRDDNLLSYPPGYGGKENDPPSYHHDHHDPPSYPPGYHHDHHDHPEGYHHRLPHTYIPKHETHKTEHRPTMPHTFTPKHSTHKTIHRPTVTGYHTRPHTHGPPPYQSIEPYNKPHYKRDAGPTPAAIQQRDAMATKSAQWYDYYATLAACGYDCIQTACSCVGSAKTVYETPAPTCTFTKTKETVVHETKTIDV